MGAFLAVCHAAAKLANPGNGPLLSLVGMGYNHLSDATNRVIVMTPRLAGSPARR